jgi:hypothetical protein
LKRERKETRERERKRAFSKYFSDSWLENDENPPETD